MPQMDPRMLQMMMAQQQQNIPPNIGSSEPDGMPPMAPMRPMPGGMPAQMGPPQNTQASPQMGGGGFMGAAQANQQNPQGAMPPAGDMPPPGGVSPRIPPNIGSSEPDGMPPQQGMSPQMQNDMLMHMMQNMHPDMKQQIIQQLSSSLAAQGRGGDNTIAHLTPGEITVPPQVQNKKVLATLNKAFKDKGAAAHQFTVGSPTQSVNPQTGLPEYGFFNSGFMKAALPIIGGIGANMLVPGAGLALSSALTGLGSAAGGLAAGEKPAQALLGGVGAGVGGYALGNISQGLTAMGNPTGVAGTVGDATHAATQAIPANSVWPGSGAPIASEGAVGGIPGAPIGNSIGPSAVNPNSTTLPILGKVNPYQMMGGAAGSAAGGFLGASLSKKPLTGPQLPPGFNDPYSPGSGSWQDQLGQTAYSGPKPNFNGYNPATNFPSKHNFYPIPA